MTNCARDQCLTVPLRPPLALGLLAVFVSGAGYPIYRSQTWHSAVTVQLAEVGGTALVRSGSAEIGQGSDTVLGMIAAEALGYRPQDIHGFVEMVPMGDAEIIRLQYEENHAYMQ